MFHIRRSLRSSRVDLVGTSDVVKALAMLYALNMSERLLTDDDIKELHLFAVEVARALGLDHILDEMTTADMSLKLMAKYILDVVGAALPARERNDLCNFIKSA